MRDPRGRTHGQAASGGSKHAGWSGCQNAGKATRRTAASTDRDARGSRWDRTAPARRADGIQAATAGSRPRWCVWWACSPPVERLRANLLTFPLGLRGRVGFSSLGCQGCCLCFSSQNKSSRRSRNRQSHPASTTTKFTRQTSPCRAAA